jgi:hypothetical protein
VKRWKQEAEILRKQELEHRIAANEKMRQKIDFGAHAESTAAIASSMVDMSQFPHDGGGGSRGSAAPMYGGSASRGALKRKRQTQAPAQPQQPPQLAEVAAVAAAMPAGLERAHSFTGVSASQTEC